MPMMLIGLIALSTLSIHLSIVSLPVKEETTHRKVPTAPGFTYIEEETFFCGGQTNTVKMYRHDKTGLEFALEGGRGSIWGAPGSPAGDRLYSYAADRTGRKGVETSYTPSRGVI